MNNDKEALRTALSKALMCLGHSVTVEFTEKENDVIEAEVSWYPWGEEVTDITEDLLKSGHLLTGSFAYFRVKKGEDRRTETFTLDHRNIFSFMSRVIDMVAMASGAALHPALRYPPQVEQSE